MCTGGNYRSIYLIYFLTYFRRRTGSNLFDFFYCMKFISRIYTFRAIASKEIFIKFQSGHFFHNRDTFVFCNTWINSRFIHHNIPFGDYLTNSCAGTVKRSPIRIVVFVYRSGNGNYIKIVITDFLYIGSTLKTIGKGRLE